MQPKTIKSNDNNIFENGKRLQFLFEGGQPNFFINGRRPQKIWSNQKQLKVKTMVVGPLQVTMFINCYAK
jgi:hypothetical protein